jgi:hypothetical protein
VPREQLVSDIDERDGAVVVDQEADRRPGGVGRRWYAGPNFSYWIAQA